MFPTRDLQQAAKQSSTILVFFDIIKLNIPLTLATLILLQLRLKTLYFSVISTDFARNSSLYLLFLSQKASKFQKINAYVYLKRANPSFCYSKNSICYNNCLLQFFQSQKICVLVRIEVQQAANEVIGRNLPQFVIVMTRNVILWAIYLINRSLQWVYFHQISMIYTFFFP